jgi:hypothetical protein
MPLYVTDNPNTTTIVAVAQFSDATNPKLSNRPGAVDFRAAVIPQVIVGGVSYPLRRMFVGRYYRFLEQLIVDGVSPLIVGRGTSESTAKEDFCLQIHCAIQDLLGKRPFELSNQDKQLLAIIDRFVDLTVLRNTQPIQVRQYGKVTRARPYPEEIEWENGTKDIVPVSVVLTPEYVTYKPGQPVEALVERDPMTFRLRRIVHIKKCKASRIRSNSEDQEFMLSIGSSGTAKADPDWRP